MLIDTHCHLDFPEFQQDREVVINRAKDNNVEYIINIGSSLKGSQESLSLSKRYECIWAAVGMHPHDADEFNSEAFVQLQEFSKAQKVVAIGETGLDFYKNYSSKQNQLKLFYALIDLAKKSKLPLIIHSRQAQDDVVRILKECMPLDAVVHCFSGDEHFLQTCLELGFFVSFTCNITYKKAQGLRDLVKLTPLGRLMLETDAPFLSPEEFRGRRNEPMYVSLLAQHIAKIKEIDVMEVEKVTTENAKRFFKIG